MKLTLYKRILLIMTAGILCVFTVFIISIQLMSHTYEKTLYQTNATMLNQASSAIETRMKAIESISYDILTNAEIQSDLMDLNDSPTDNKTAITRRDIYTTLNTYTFYDHYIESINLMIPKQKNICVGNSSDIDNFNIKNAASNIEHAAGKTVWQPEDTPGSLTLCGREIRQIKYLSLKKLSMLYITVNMEALINDALKSSGYRSKDSRFILYANEKRIYPAASYHDSVVKALLKEPITKSNSYTIKTFDSKRKFIIHGVLSPYHFDYLFVRDYDTIFLNIQKSKFYVILTSSVFCILAMMNTRFFIKKITRHIDFLIEKIKCFGKGKKIPVSNYNYENRTDEIGQLHQNFDAMTKNVIRLRDENYDKQILLKDTTIKMLQQQINPHFLYNTLDTMNWLAQKYGADDISSIATALGDLFRASISGEKDIIPLSEELGILDNYITIQKIRFKDRLTFTLCIPDDMDTIYLPKLCIQPLVENAIKYSMDYNDEPCYIYVKIEKYESCYMIEVSNTGSSFADDLLNKMKTQKLLPKGSGIGLLNIDKRLRLLYGDEYGLHISNKNGMATVMLSIPKKKS